MSDKPKVELYNKFDIVIHHGVGDVINELVERIHQYCKKHGLTASFNINEAAGEELMRRPHNKDVEVRPGAPDAQHSPSPQRVAQALSGRVPVTRSYHEWDSRGHWRVHIWKCPACGCDMKAVSPTVPLNQKITGTVQYRVPCTECSREFEIFEPLTDLPSSITAERVAQALSGRVMALDVSWRVAQKPEHVILWQCPVCGEQWKTSRGESLTFPLTAECCKCKRAYEISPPQEGASQ